VSHTGKVEQGEGDMDRDEARWSSQRLAAVHTIEKGWVRATP
jgi:hypothetical protein